MVITTIFLVVIIFLLIKTLDKYAPIALLYGGIFWLHFYIWEWICWLLGIMMTIGLIYMWFKNNINGDSKEVF